MWEVILEDETGNLTLEEVEPGDGSCLKSFTEGGKKKELNTELSLEDKVRLKGLGVIGSINMNQTGLIGARNRYEPFLEKQGFKFVKIEKHSTPDETWYLLVYKRKVKNFITVVEIAADGYWSLNFGNNNVPDVSGSGIRDLKEALEET